MTAVVGIFFCRVFFRSFIFAVFRLSLMPLLVPIANVALSSFVRIPFALIRFIYVFFYALHVFCVASRILLPFLWSLSRS